MSTHMPTLFDDEEYFVPPPKKETRKKKDLPQTEDEGLKEPEAPAAIEAEEAAPVMEAAPEADVETDVPGEIIPEEPELSSATIVNIEADLAEEANPVVEATPGIVEEAITEPGDASSATITAIDTDLSVEAAPFLEAEPETKEEVEIVEETTSGQEEVLPETSAAINADPVAATIQEAETTDEVVPEAPEAILIEAPEEVTPVAEAAINEATAADHDEAIEPEAAVLPEVLNEISEEQVLELEEPVTELIATDPFTEIVEVSAVDELVVEVPKSTPGITFEIPEEDEEPAIELEMTARPIPAVKEDKVDDLDLLMRSELISQDYTAFSGFEFEPATEKKKIIPEPEDTEITDDTADNDPEPEDISLAVREIDAADLDFEFESDALASTLPEFELEDKYYTIGEVAALFGVNVSHIRFWTTEFNLKVRTTRKGDRLYNPGNIARLRLIHHLVKENGFTIKGAKDKLKNQKQNVSVQADLKDKLSGLKDKLERIKKNL